MHFASVAGATVFLILTYPDPYFPRLLVRDYIRETFGDEETMQVESSTTKAQEAPTTATPAAAAVAAPKPMVRKGGRGGRGVQFWDVTMFKLKCLKCVHCVFRAVWRV